MSISRTCVTVCVVSLLASASFAQPTQGDWELMLGGNGSNDSDFESGGGNIAGSIGHYLTDNFELGFRQDCTHVDTGNDSAWNASSRVFADLHMNLADGKVRPFVGLSVGGIYGDGVNDTGVGGPEIGIKVHLNDSTFLYGLAEYQFLFEDSDDVEDNIDDGRFVYTIGLGFSW